MCWSVGRFERVREGVTESAWRKFLLQEVIGYVAFRATGYFLLLYSSTNLLHHSSPEYFAMDSALRVTHSFGASFNLNSKLIGFSS